MVQDYPYEADGVGDWLSHFKGEAGPWTGPPLVVLSLFDGLGGIWQALTILGIPFSGYSSEVVSKNKDLKIKLLQILFQLEFLTLLKIFAVGELLNMSESLLGNLFCCRSQQRYKL